MSSSSHYYSQGDIIILDNDDDNINLPYVDEYDILPPLPSEIQDSYPNAPLEFYPSKKSIEIKRDVSNNNAAQNADINSNNDRRGSLYQQWSCKLHESFKIAKTRTQIDYKKMKDFTFQYWTPALARTIVTLCNLLIYFDSSVIGACLPSIEVDLSLTEIQTGSLNLGLILCYMLTSLFFVKTTNWISPPLLMTMGMTLGTVGVFACYLSDDFIEFFFSRMLIGVGNAIFIGMAPVYINEVAPKEPEDLGPTWMSYFYLGTPVGLALGFTCAGIITEVLHWKANFLLEFFILMVLCSLLFMMPTAKDFNFKKHKNPDLLILQDIEIDKSDKEENGNVSYAIPDKYQIIQENVKVNTHYGIPEMSDDLRNEMLESQNDYSEYNKGLTPKKEQHVDTFTILTKLTAIWRSMYLLLKEKTYFFAILGSSSLTFMSASLAYWLTTYIHQEFHISLVITNAVVGSMTIFTGLAGIYISGRVVGYYCNKASKSKDRTFSGWLHKFYTKLYRFDPIRLFGYQTAIMYTPYDRQNFLKPNLSKNKPQNIDIHDFAILDTGREEETPGKGEPVENNDLEGEPEYVNHIPHLLTEKEITTIVTLRYICLCVIILFPFFLCASFTSHIIIFFFCLLVSEFLLFSCVMPANTCIINSVEDEQKESAMFVKQFFIHLLGELPSPVIFGIIKYLWNFHVCMFFLCFFLFSVLFSFFNAEKHASQKKIL